MKNDAFEESAYSPDAAVIERRRNARRRDVRQADIALAMLLLILYFEQRANPHNNVVTRFLDTSNISVPFLVDNLSTIILALLGLLASRAAYKTIRAYAKRSDLSARLNGMEARPEAVSGNDGMVQDKSTTKKSWRLLGDAAQRQNDLYLASNSYKFKEFTDWIRIGMVIFFGLGLCRYFYINGIEHEPVAQALPVGQRDIDLNKNVLDVNRLGNQTISIMPMRDLSSMRLSDMLRTRIDAMRPFAQAMPAGKYVPFAPIFSQIVDSRPWWSWNALLTMSAGEHVTTGASFRSQPLLNPMALIWPSVWEQSLNLSGYLNVEKAHSDPDFPLQPQSSSIIFDQASKRFDIHFDMTRYNAALAKFTTTDLKGESFVNFHGVNARDLGYPYIFLDPRLSSGIEKMNSKTQMTASTEFYHVGPACGVTGGCNNLSPRLEGLSEYMIYTLPAVVSFKLWHAEPASQNDEADITYVMHFD